MDCSCGKSMGLGSGPVVMWAKLVQFLIGLDGTFRNGNQLERVLKY
jgi:hypothetical protein